MAIQLMSNVKIITSGIAPTTANLLPGQAAFGKITTDGKYHLFGNTGEGGGAGKVVDIVLDTYASLSAISFDDALKAGNTTKLSAIFQDAEGNSKVTISSAGVDVAEGGKITIGGKNMFYAGLASVSEDDAAKMRGLLSVYSKAEVDGMVAGAFHFKGDVEAFANLPTNAKAGDVYVVKTAGGTDIHGIKVNANDSVAYVDAHGDDPAGWIVLSGVFDLSAYYTSEQVDGLLTSYAKSADVYTKTAADDKFLSKTDADTTYAKKTAVYTKEEIDEAHSTMNASITAAKTQADKGVKDAATAATAAATAKSAADAAQTDATQAIADAAAAKTQADKGVADAAAASTAAGKAQTKADEAAAAAATNAGEITKSNARIKTLEDAGYQTAADVTKTLTDGNYVKDANYVHTDNNYNAAAVASVAKAEKLVVDGDGSKVLKDDGSYDTLELTVVSI